HPRLLRTGRRRGIRWRLFRVRPARRTRSRAATGGSGERTRRLIERPAFRLPARPAKLRHMTPPIRLANLVDGRLQAPQAGRYLDVHEPATGAVFARCPASDANDVDAAVAAAQRAFPAWAAQAPERRAVLLGRLADLVERDLDALARLESRDSGKPV